MLWRRGSSTPVHSQANLLQKSVMRCEYHPVALLYTWYRVKFAGHDIYDLLHMCLLLLASYQYFVMIGAGHDLLQPPLPVLHHNGNDNKEVRAMKMKRPPGLHALRCTVVTAVPYNEIASEKNTQLLSL